MIRALCRKLVPAAARRATRQRISRWQIERAIRPLRAQGYLTRSELAEFRSAWSNEGFSADITYLAELMRLIDKNPGDVLECGTGATTIIAGVLAERLKFRVFCLEQDAEWLAVGQKAVKYHRLSRVEILHAPLKTFGNYSWYDISPAALPSSFGVVICDGPFIDKALGEPHYSQWRYGILPFLRCKRASFGSLLLDDVNDPRAPHVLENWKKQFGISYDLIQSGDGLAGILSSHSFNGHTD